MYFENLVWLFFIFIGWVHLALNTLWKTRALFPSESQLYYNVRSNTWEGDQSVAEIHRWGLWMPIALEDKVQSREFSWDTLASLWPSCSPVYLLDSHLPFQKLSVQTQHFCVALLSGKYLFPLLTSTLFSYSVWEVCLPKKISPLLWLFSPFLLSSPPVLCPPLPPYTVGFCCLCLQVPYYTL